MATTAEEIKARIASAGSNSVSWMDSDTPAVIQPEGQEKVVEDGGLTSPIEDSETGKDVSNEDWARVAVDALEHAKESISARWLTVEKDSKDLCVKLTDTLESADIILTELTKAQATFYHHLNVELPQSMKAVAEKILEGRLQSIAQDITKNAGFDIESKFNPLLKKVDDAVINLRLAANEVEAKTGGSRPLINQAIVSMVVTGILFLGLNIYFRLGTDAEYGRKAKAAVMKLDHANRTVMENLIQGK